VALILTIETMIPDISYLELFLIVGAFVFGGLCKGISGVGVPIIAVPVIASVTDITLAIILIAIPSVVPNFYQVWKFKASWTRPFSLTTLCIASVVGSGIGVLLLLKVDPEMLSKILGLIVISYCAIQRLQPLNLSEQMTRALAAPMGFLAGLAGGTTGVSAPVIMMYMSAINLVRGSFIFGISVYFIAMGTGQFVWLGLAGLMTWELAAASALTLIPIALGMSLGQKIGEHVSQAQFEKVIQSILVVLGLKLLLNI
jgi:uncharacterized membrane protein YfcA